MSKIIKTSLFSFLLVATSVFSNSATAGVEVAFENGKSFSDYQLSGRSKSKSLEVLQKDMATLFTEVAKDFIQSDQKMKVTITNIDLAGRIVYSAGGSGQDIRVLRDNNFIRLYFTYELTDASGKVIKQGQYQLKDFSDDHRPKRNFKLSEGTVNHFRKPLKEWFEANFSN